MKNPIILILGRKSAHVIGSALMAKGKIKPETFPPEHRRGHPIRASFHAHAPLGLQLCKRTLRTIREYQRYENGKCR